MRAEDRKAELLTYTAELLIESGADALTMEALARRAGVNRALPYYYFDSRDNLLVVLFQEHAQAFDELVAEALEGQETLEAKLRAILGAYVESVNTHGPVLEALDHAHTDTGTLEAQRLERLVENGLKMGVMFQDHTNLDAANALTLAALTMGAAQGLLAASAAVKVPPSTEQIEGLVRFALAGIDSYVAGVD
jgi:AcrR family transcriptional regulator